VVSHPLRNIVLPKPSLFSEVTDVLTDKFVQRRDARKRSGLLCCPTHCLLTLEHQAVFDNALDLARLKGVSDVRLKTRLWQWRVENDLTLQEEADLTGMSISYLSRLERGLRQASPKTKVLLARRLGVGVRDLFDVEPVEES
jgi:DNA-binding XRE family transcriptional regulator